MLATPPPSSVYHRDDVGEVDAGQTGRAPGDESPQLVRNIEQNANNHCRVTAPAGPAGPTSSASATCVAAGPRRTAT
jgi:hypothetical protein